MIVGSNYSQIPDDTNTNYSENTNYTNNTDYTFEYSDNLNVGTATITVTDENGAELEVNGEKVVLTDGKYIITEAGAYRIVAADAAGNKATASFDVLAAHETREIITEATCTDAGSKSQVCYNCNKAVGESETITAPEAVAVHWDVGVL